MNFDTYAISADCTVSSRRTPSRTLDSAKCSAIQNVLTRDDVVQALSASEAPRCDYAGTDTALVIGSLSLTTGDVTHGIDITTCAYAGVSPYSDVLDVVGSVL